MTENSLVDNNVSQTSVGEYVLADLIGSGGYGAVYRGYHRERPDEVLAIKIVQSKDKWEISTYDPKIFEARNLTEISGHPNIVNIRDYFFHESRFIIVMEHVNDTSLSELLKERGRLSSEEVIDFLFQMADALKYAHLKNVVHRDIKLSNILFADDKQRRRYVLVDFGISRIVQGIQTEKHVGGTYYFMSPEQLRGRFGKESDLWAVGAVAYMLLTGERPFAGETVEELSQKILFSTPIAPSTVVENVNPDLERIIFELLEKQGVNRISDAEKLLETLNTTFDIPYLIVPVKPSPVSTEPIPKTTWEQQHEKMTKKTLKNFWIFAVISILSVNIISKISQICGYVLFYKGEENKAFTWQSVAGVTLLFASFVLSWIFMFALNDLSDKYKTIINVLFAISAVLNSIAMIVAMYYLARYKHLKRELFIIRSLLNSSGDVEIYLKNFKDFVDIYPGDFYIHIRYIESLILQGMIQKAVVESVIFLESDPYNKEVSLLLAHVYFELGLYSDCVHVCDGYLSVSGYSFEFFDLKNKCYQMMGGVQHGNV